MNDNSFMDSMQSLFSIEEQELFAGIKASLAVKEHAVPKMDMNFGDKLLQLGKSHKVVPLMYSIYGENEDVPESIRKQITNETVSCVKQQYRIAFLTKYLIGLLENEKIAVVLLKGAGVAGYYPTPEYRKSGDIDLLLLEPDKLEKVTSIMLENGLKLCGEQHALHHVCFDTEEGISLEVHTSIAEPFDNESMNSDMNRLIPDCRNEITGKECFGVTFPVLSKAYNGYALLLHMLQHYLRAGFGLKLICDWVVFWKEESDERTQDIYLKLVEKSGVKGFSDMITSCCIRFLGLDEKRVTWMKMDRLFKVDQFMREILDAGEFGREDKKRMVVMRNSHLGGYLREFHHQMRLRYPAQSKRIILWPVLWIRTLWIFLKNNKEVRGVSTRDILRQAAKRSQVAEELRLFQTSKKL